MQCERCCFNQSEYGGPSTLFYPNCSGAPALSAWLCRPCEILAFDAVRQITRELSRHTAAGYAASVAGRPIDPNVTSSMFPRWAADHFEKTLRLEDEAISAIRAWLKEGHAAR